MGVIVQQIYYNYRLVMCTFLLAQRTYVSGKIKKRGNSSEDFYKSFIKG